MTCLCGHTEGEHRWDGVQTMCFRKYCDCAWFVAVLERPLT